MTTRITYYLNGLAYAERYRELVPRVDDEVRFKGVVYKVLRVVWIEDEGGHLDDARVAVDIAEVEA